MWFGTKGGLSRYDGMSFRNFKRDMNDNHSLGNNFVTCLYEDKKGISGLVRMPECIFIILPARSLLLLTCKVRKTSKSTGLFLQFREIRKDGFG